MFHQNHKAKEYVRMSHKGLWNYAFSSYKPMLLFWRSLRLFSSHGSLIKGVNFGQRQVL